MPLNCVAATQPPPHASRAYLFACPPFDSAVRGQVQPADQLRHAPRHGHAPHVQGALRACPGSHSLELGPSRAYASLHQRRYTAPRPHTPPGPYTSSRVACTPFDSAGGVGVQPAAQLRHVQGHKHEPHVRGALRACPGPPVLSRSPPCACHLRRRHPTPSRLPRAPYLFSRRMSATFDSAEREGVQPSAQLRHVQGHKQAEHVHRVLRACPAPP